MYQGAADIIGALLTEQKIGPLDAGAVAMAGKLDGGSFAETAGLSSDVADLLSGLSERVLLSGLKLGASDGKGAVLPTRSRFSAY